MDLYHIPNDTGGDWRLNKYCEYQSAVPPINPITYTAYARKHNLSKDNCIYLAWLNSTCYSAETAIFMYTQLPLIHVNKRICDKFWQDYKPYLTFISARRYVKNMDWFVDLIRSFIKYFSKSPYGAIQSLCKKSPEENYKTLFDYVNNIKYMGRFSTDLFMEALVHMSYCKVLDIKFQYPSFSWQKGSNITSAVFNIFYKDEAANKYDKTRRITPKQEVWLNKKLKLIQKRIQELYPEQNSDIAEITPKLCSFRNLFKSSRYGGFHHDRQLEILLKYKRDMPEYSSLWDEIFEIRYNEFDHRLLGELNGWDGIRKERKKLWLNEGKTGVEYE